MNRQEFVAAETTIRDTLKIYDNPAPWFRPGTGARSCRGARLAGQKNFADAEPLLTAGCHGMVKNPTRCWVKMSERFCSKRGIISLRLFGVH
jgi:hypothetical protein